MLEGFLLIDKPSGPTSHDMVDAVRHAINIRQVGHSGTLDPFATGLLIIGIGSATKKLGALVGLDKEYEATLRLGATSDTYDRTGRITESGVRCQMSDVPEVLKKFTGQIQQIPPMYSAKKVKGKKLYELARAGIEIERKPVTLTIYSIELLHNPSPPPLTLRGGEAQLQLRVHCSSGTYIRALAHDIGQALGCGAYLEELRRTAIGSFRAHDALAGNNLTLQNITENLRAEL